MLPWNNSTFVSSKKQIRSCSGVFFVRLWGNKIPPNTLNSVKGKLCRNCTLPPPHSCLDPVHVLFISSIPVTQGFAGHAPHWLGLLSGVTGGDAGRCRKRAWMAPQFSVPVGERGCTCVRCPAFLQGEPLQSDNEGSICERPIWSHATAFNSPLALLFARPFASNPPDLNLPLALPLGQITLSSSGPNIWSALVNTKTEGCFCK